MGKTPQQTQLRSKPGSGLPPAKLVPDQNTLTSQLPNEVTPFEWPFANFPVILPQNPLDLGAPNVQTFPGFSMLPPLQMLPIDMNYINALIAALTSMQTFPGTGGGMTVPQQLLPPQPIFPIIVAQMGPQGAVLSSEEMQPPSQILTGLLVPGMQGGLLPSGQSGALPEGQEGFLPAGQTGSNLPLPEGTAGVTAPAGLQKIFPTANDDLSDVANGPYPTPSGFQMPIAVTNEVFAEYAIKINMEPSELREPPTSAVKLEQDNNQKHHNLSRLLVRGDSYVPTNTVATKSLKEP